MYVKEWCNTYMGPNEQAYELFGECNKGELVHLTGQVKEESDWYEYEAETGDKGFISGDYLVVKNPLQQETAQKPNTPEQPKQEQPVQEQPQPEQSDHDRPYDPTIGREWQIGDDMGYGIYIGSYDDLESDW